MSQRIEFPYPSVIGDDKQFPLFGKLITGYRATDFYVSLRVEYFINQNAMDPINHRQANSSNVRKQLERLFKGIIHGSWYPEEWYSCVEIYWNRMESL